MNGRGTLMTSTPICFRSELRIFIISKILIISKSIILTGDKDVILQSRRFTRFAIENEIMKI